MEKNWNVKDGHIMVKTPLVQELPSIEVTLRSGRTTYHFIGSYDGQKGLPDKVLRLIEKGGENQGEKFTK